MRRLLDASRTAQAELDEALVRILIGMAMSQLPSGRSRNRRAPMAEINVTPMVDVMLVLLIIFMVTAPLLASGVPVTLPESRAKSLEQDKEPVQLSLADDGQLFIDDKPVEMIDLPVRLAAIAARGVDEPPQIYLRADTKLDYGRVMAVMGELNRAGLNRVALLTTTAGQEAE
jgi:biopolymer transport protein TolR